MYDITSKSADDFINHEEILDTIKYADENKNNIKLIDSILEKAKLRKGLSHREASVLLACKDENKNNEMFKLAEQIKKDFYGNRIVMFAPLYLSNYCVNGCVYCPYHAKNKHIARKKLTQEEIKKEVIALQDMGHKRLALEAGEDPVNNTMDYYLECIKTIYSIKHKNGAIRRVNINIAATTVENYRLLKEAGIGTYILFQETYHTDKYETLHLMGHKRVWPYRFDAQERALIGGMRGAGFSALLGLDDFRKDALATALHVYYINRKYPHAELSLSCPRLRPIVNNDRINPRDVGEKELCQVLCAYRIFLPFAGITVSSRESATFRNGIAKICATKVSAGVSTGIGDHEEKYEGKEDDNVGDEQFEINDDRSFGKMYEDMEQGGLQPVLNDYIYV